MRRISSASFLTWKARPADACFPTQRPQALLLSPVYPSTLANRPSDNLADDNPFDLTRLEVWYNDAFLDLAEPEEIVTTNDPDVDLDPVPKPSVDSGLDYLALLRLERERLIQEQIDTIHFTQLDDSNPKEDSPNDRSQ